MNQTEWKVPFTGLQRQHVLLRPEIDKAIARVLDSCAFNLSKEVSQFEADFAKYCGAAFGTGVNNGTSALHLALLACGVGAGDEVIAPAMTFIATISAIDYCGARPVFVDVDPKTFTIDPARIRGAITPRTKAIIPVHLYGNVAAMSEILAIATEHKLAIVEDAAQAHGAYYREARVGTLGRFGCFSFYPSKNLGACGEGGLLTCQSETDAGVVRALRDWGQKEKYRHEMKGFNYRLEAIQGAILATKLPYLDRWNERRVEVARTFHSELAHLPVQLIQETPNTSPVYHLFPVLFEKRDMLLAHLVKNGIQCLQHYPIPCHLQPAFGHLGHKPGSFPMSERIASEELSLPIFPEMNDQEVELVVGAMNSFFR